MLKTIFFINFVFICSCHASINVNIPQCDNDLSSIVQDYFDDRLCVTIIEILETYLNSDLYFKSILKPIISLRIYDRDFNDTFIPKVRPSRDIFSTDGIIQNFCQESNEGILLFAPNFTVLKSYSFGAYVSPFLSSQNKFFMIVNENIEKEDYLNFCQSIWKIFRTPYLVAATKNCTIFAYNPIRKMNDTWGELGEYNIDEVKSKKKLLKYDLKDLNGYPFKIAAFEGLMTIKLFKNDTFVDFGGVDGFYIDMLVKHMNGTKIYIPNIPVVYFVISNGNYVGALRYIIEGEAEILGVNFFMKTFRTNNVDYSPAMGTEQNCILLRKSDKLPVWYIFKVSPLQDDFFTQR